MFVTEYHKILKIVSLEKSTEVYLVSLYTQYQYEDGEINLTRASCSPCVISFAVADGVYTVTEYWVPEDGDSYDSSVRNKFPDDIEDVNTDLLGPDAMEICNQRAKEYFESNNFADKTVNP